MEEKLRAAGRSITLRRTVNRWLEYALAVWIAALAVLFLGGWGGVNFIGVVVILLLLGCAFAAVAIVHNLRFIESARYERSLSRSGDKPSPENRLHGV